MFGLGVQGRGEDLEDEEKQTKVTWCFERYDKAEVDSVFLPLTLLERP